MDWKRARKGDHEEAVDFRAKMVVAGIRVGKMENKCDHFGDGNDRTCYDGLDEKRRG